jgi:hypothetical protein
MIDLLNWIFASPYRSIIACEIIICVAVAVWLKLFLMMEDI